jgi:hypothetical protein
MDADEGVAARCAQLRHQLAEALESGAERGIGGTPHPSTVRCRDDECPVAPRHDEVEVVDQAVIPVAEQDEVRQVGASAEEPVAEVMGVQPFDPGLGAAGAGAAAVATHEGSALRLGGPPLPAAHCERFAALLDHCHDGRLAEDPPDVRPRECGPAFQVGATGRGVVGHDGGVDVHDDLAARGVTGAPVGVGGDLGRPGDGRETTGRGALTGRADVDVSRRRRRVATGLLLLRAFAPGVPLDLRLDRRDEDSALVRAHAHRHVQHARFVPPVVERLPAGQRLLTGIEPVCPAPLPHGALDLGCRRLEGQVQQGHLGVRLGDAGQGAHLRIGQPPLGERRLDQRERLERTGNTDVLPRSTGGEPALPGQPVGAGHDPHGVPSVSSVELGDQAEPGRGGRGQADGAGGDGRRQLG